MLALFFPKFRSKTAKQNTEIQKENRETKHDISWKNNTSKNIWRANFWCKTVEHNTKNFEKATGPTNASAETPQKRNMAQSMGQQMRPQKPRRNEIWPKVGKCLIRLYLCQIFQLKLLLFNVRANNYSPYLTRTSDRRTSDASLANYF